jgi:cytochrome oxidase Cu insertion factor (SCO1/SenC/PrrC family)
MVMRHRLIATIFSFIACFAVYAQDVCVINGKIADDKLANGKAIKKVFLTSADEYGRRTVVAEAKVKKGSYTFKYKTSADAPVMQYTITGFDNEKGIKLFVEPGTVAVNTATAQNPCQSKLSGTPTNDLYEEYKQIDINADEKVAKAVEALAQQNGKEWLESKEGKQEVKRIEATERIKREADRIRFLIDHNASPMTPLEMECRVMPYLSNAYAEQMMKSVYTPLQKHPYYQSFRNAVLARNIKVGNEVPDIAITLRDGKTVKLNDNRGKYILLDFWASTCEKSMQNRNTLKELYQATKEEQDKFVIVSLSLDSDKNAWGNALDNNGLALDGWVQGNDTMGTESIAAKQFGVKNTPHMILIDPEGRAISLNMEADEVQMRVEQILEGDLYYLDQSKE